MLGTDLLEVLRMRGFVVQAPSSQELDITNPESVAGIAVERWGTVDWLINCAAYTAVDKAETEPEQAAALNTLGPAFLAQACALKGIRFLHVSTDFVFDGAGVGPYREEAPTLPLGVYGRTKRDGEEGVLAHAPQSVIVRTAWLYGAHGQCFPKTMIRAWLAGRALRVVGDQIGNPTHTFELARVLAEIVETRLDGGIYHAAGPSAMSWHRLALDALEVFHEVTGVAPHPIAIESIVTADWPTPAQRPANSTLDPANSTLDFSKLAGHGITPMEPVREGLRNFVVRWIETDEAIRSLAEVR